METSLFTSLNDKDSKDNIDHNSQSPFKRKYYAGSRLEFQNCTLGGGLFDKENLSKQPSFGPLADSRNLFASPIAKKDTLRMDPSV